MLQTHWAVAAVVPHVLQRIVDFHPNDVYTAIAPVTTLGNLVTPLAMGIMLVICVTTALTPHTNKVHRFNYTHEVSLIGQCNNEPS